jgi:hypothetical protein
LNRFIREVHPQGKTSNQLPKLLPHVPRNDGTRIADSATRNHASLDDTAEGDEDMSGSDSSAGSDDKPELETEDFIRAPRKRLREIWDLISHSEDDGLSHGDNNEAYEKERAKVMFRGYA